MKKRAVVLLSGGLDSATVAYIAHNDGYDLISLNLDYGQRHQVELISADKLTQKLSIPRKIQLKIDLRHIGGSALTDNIPVPKGGKEIGQENFIPSTYVPARNLIFLSIAASVAETNKAEAIFLGVNILDYSGYPDCRPDFLNSFQDTLRLGTKIGQNRLIKIKSPLIRMSKKDIILCAEKLGVPFDSTWSCYDPIEKENKFIPCTECDSCILRAKGFKEANLIDPIIKAGIKK